MTPQPVQPSPDLLAWIEEWAGAVRRRDIERGRAMFAPDVVAFGTRNVRLDGLDELATRQWAPVWGTTTGFTIDLATLRVFDSGELTVIAGQWASEATGDDEGRRRSGRVTLVLGRDDGGRLVARHSHFSMDPGVAP